MYKSFYSLSKAPFGKDIETNDAFVSSEYESAMGALRFLQQSKGIGLIMSEPGAGKSFVFGLLRII